MLRSPRRLPNRFNRPVTPQTRRLVERRHKRKRQNAAMRWQHTTHRLKRRANSFKKTAKQFAIFIVSGLVLLCIGLALFSPIMHIQEIRIARSDPRIDAEIVQRSLGDLFDQHLFFLSTQEVGDILKQSVPDLDSAQITKQYPSTLQIRLMLDPIVAKLTIDEPPAVQPATGSGNLSESGAVIVESPLEDYLTEEGMYVTYLPSQVEGGSGGMIELRVVDWGVRPEPWKRLVDESTLNLIRQAEMELQSQFGLTVTEKVVYLRAREFHLRTEKYSLWFDHRSTVAEQLQRYRMFIESIGADKAREYIDLRLKDKIVYK